MYHSNVKGLCISVYNMCILFPDPAMGLIVVVVVVVVYFSDMFHKTIVKYVYTCRYKNPSQFRAYNSTLIQIRLKQQITDLDVYLHGVIYELRELDKMEVDDVTFIDVFN